MNKGIATFQRSLNLVRQGLDFWQNVTNPTNLIGYQQFIFQNSFEHAIAIGQCLCPHWTALCTIGCADDSIRYSARKVEEFVFSFISEKITFAFFFL